MKKNYKNIFLIIIFFLFNSVSFSDEDKKIRENISIDLCNKIYAKLNFGNENYNEKINVYHKLKIDSIFIDEINDTFNILADRHFTYKDYSVLNLFEEFTEYKIIEQNLGKEEDIYCKYDLDKALTDRKIKDFQFFFDNLNETESYASNWIKIYTSGWVYYSYYDELYKFSNNELNFKKFPFDQHELKIVQYSDVPNYIEFKISNSAKERLILNNKNKDFGISSPGWKINFLNYDTEYKRTFWKEDGKDLNSRITTIINIERNSFSYLIKFGLPIVFIVFIALSVFWIDIKNIRTRVELSIISLLSLIAFNFVMSDKLPDYNYLTVYDSLTLISYLFVGLSGLLTIYVNYSYVEKKDRKTSFIVDQRCRKFSFPVYLLINLILILIFFTD